MAAKTALIIDDEPDITTYHGTLLADHGWSVLTANSANDGLAVARDHRPSIVLLDVMMPERGGLSTLVALRKDERTKDIPVVLVTGIQATLNADFSAFLDRFNHYNPNGYVQKPVEPAALLEMLDGLISA